MPPKAIEVVTVLGESVVDVQYCTERERSRSPRVLAITGLACLLAAAIAFGASVTVAARNDAAFEHWTSVAKRPAYAFRPERSTVALDVLALGGAALGLCLLTGALVRRTSRRRDVTVDGATYSFDELADVAGRIEAREGPAAFVIKCTDAPEPVTLHKRRGELRPLVYAVGSLAVHLGLVMLMSRVILEEDVRIAWGKQHGISLDEGTTNGVEENALPLEEGGVPTPPLRLDDVRRDHPPHPRLRVPEFDPQLERQRGIDARRRAIDDARNAGVLGSMFLRDSAVTLELRLLEPDTLETAFAVTSVPTLVPADQYGFGFSRSGFGVCGGIHGYGTIGVGRYGTLGYGVGVVNEPLRERTHRAAVPATVAHQPTIAGSYTRPVIRRYIRRQLDRIRYCYEKELMRKPTIEGTMSVSFVVDPSGVVTSSVGTGFDPNVASCVAGVIATIRFAVAEGPSQVNYPFTFRPAS